MQALTDAAWPAPGLVDTWIRFSTDGRPLHGTKDIQPRVQTRGDKVGGDRRVAVAQACRDLEIAESVLRRWMRETEAVPRHAIPSHCQVNSVSIERAEGQSAFTHLGRAGIRASRGTVWGRHIDIFNAWRFRTKVFALAVRPSGKWDSNQAKRRPR
jgi:hypothetical protein